MTPLGTPGLSLAKLSTRAAMIASISARSSMMRVSSVCVRCAAILFCSFGRFISRFLRSGQLLSCAGGLVLRSSQSLLAPAFVRRDKDLHVVWQGFEPRLLIVRPRLRCRNARNVADRRADEPAQRW